MVFFQLKFTFLFEFIILFFQYLLTVNYYSKNEFLNIYKQEPYGVPYGPFWAQQQPGNNRILKKITLFYKK